MGKAGGAGDWWLNGRMAHDFKNAADYAAAILDITGNNCHSSTGVQPGHTPGVGLILNGTSHYLITPFTAQAGSSAIIKFSGGTLSGNRCIFGVFGPDFIAPYTDMFGCHTSLDAEASNVRVSGCGSYVTVSGRVASGTMAIAGQDGYYNGLPEAVIPGPIVGSSLPLFIGARNVGGSPSQYWAGTITSFIAYDHARSDAQILATSAAMP